MIYSPNFGAKIQTYGKMEPRLEPIAWFARGLTGSDELFKGSGIHFHFHQNVPISEE